MHFEHCFIWQVPSLKDLLVHLSTFDMVLLWQIQFAPVAWKNFIIIFIINPLCAIFSFQMRWKKCNKDMNYDTYFSKEFWKMHYFSLHILWVVCKSFENLTKCRVQCLKSRVKLPYNPIIFLHRELFHLFKMSVEK